MLLALFLATLTDDARLQCDAARKDALEMRMDAALRRYDEALATFARGLADAPDVPQMARCFLDRGNHANDLKRTELAIASFMKALTLLPSIVLSPREYSPGAVQLFEQAKRRVAALPLTTLTVVTSPGAAQIELDGRPAGATPLSLTATATEHWLVLRLSGHDTVTTSVVLTAGKNERVELFLRANEAITAPASTSASAPASAPIAEQPRAVQQALPPIASSAPNEKAQVAPALAWLPLGIGQFLARRYVAGALFLAAEVICAAVSTVTFALILADRRPDGSFNAPARDQALQAVNLAAAGAALLVGVGGAIDGELHREIQ